MSRNQASEFSVYFVWVRGSGACRRFQQPAKVAMHLGCIFTRVARVIGGISVTALSNKWPRLHDIDLTAHVDPLDVLILPAKDAFNVLGGLYQPADHCVC